VKSLIRLILKKFGKKFKKVNKVKTNKKVLYVLLKENDLRTINNLRVDCFSLFPILENKSDTRIIYPDPKKTFKNSPAQVLENEKIFEDLISIINIYFDKSQILFIKELLKPYLDIKISIYLYLKSIIPKADKYKLLVNGKWKNLYDINNLIIGIENIYMKEKGNINYSLAKFTNLKINLFLKLFSFLQVFLLNKILKKYSVFILSSNKSYFMPKIFTGLKNRNMNLISYSQTNKPIKCLFILIKQFLSLILKRKLINLEFFMIPYVGKNFINFKKKNIFNNSDLIDNNYANLLLKDIESYINLNLGYKNYCDKLFIKSKDDNVAGIFHTNRFPDLNALSYTLSKFKFKQHLISHGTHTIQEESEESNFIAESLSIGMLTSNIPNIRIYSQTTFSDNYLSNKNLNFKKIKPVNNYKYINKNDSSVLRILSAGTVKQLGARRYCFESSFEYLYSIVNLCNKITNLEFEIELILRVRDVKNEIDKKTKEAIANQFKGLVKISQNIDIKDDIAHCDCLIALSSTTLEEALVSQIPSMSYGLSKYNHFDFYKSKDFQISKNLKSYSKLKKIENLLERNFLYLTKDKLKREYSIFDFIL